MTVHPHHPRCMSFFSVMAMTLMLLVEALASPSISYAQLTAAISAQAGSHKNVATVKGNDSEVPAAQRCATLRNTEFASVQDAPTQITATALVDVKGDTIYCQVQGYVSPQVKFEIRLPVNNWNGKFVETGCAGACGTVMIEWLCPSLLRKGYACIASDMGHQGQISDDLWAYNNLQAEVDFGFRAAHVTALAGKAITEHFYKKVPDKSYFCGCSTGGREAMVEAQRFPWDFDGIVAGAPASDQADIMLTRLWAALAMRAKDGSPILDHGDLQFVHRAVVVACDMNDGVRDGLIGDPRSCHYDPEELLCKDNTHTQCLSRQKVDALKKIYGGPVDSNGKRYHPDGALMLGSELAFDEYYPGHFSSFDVSFLRYGAFMPAPGPTWQLNDLDFDRDYKRFGMKASLYSADNPDLRTFKANGGKLILYQGWSDSGSGGIPPLRTVDYYETAEKTMGGPAETQKFFRLFMIPGMGHCGGGEGPDHIDYISYLERWAEGGEAPNMIVGTHVDTARLDQFLKAHDSKSPGFSKELEQFLNDPSNSEFARPIYPYPIQTKYKGTGDPDKVESFQPVHP